jgi:DNA-binding CsgD family transcriptional regulator
MTSGLLTLFHFLTFTFGFIALIFISRASGTVTPKIKRTFINQALFYNLTIIFMCVTDVFVLVSMGKTSFTSLEIDFISAMINLNNIFFVLWCLAFVLLVYRFLGIPLTGTQKTIIFSVSITLGLLTIYNFIGTLLSYKSLLQKITSDLLCFTVVFVLGYSVFLIKMSDNIEDKKRRKALKAFGRMFIGFSVLLILFYIDSVFLKALPEIVRKVFIYCIDFIFNSIIVFWSCKYYNALNLVQKEDNNNNITEDQIVARYQISKRELEIIRLVCSGQSNQEIADLLFISLGTVKNHIYNIYLKLGVKNRTCLVKMFQ